MFSELDRVMLKRPIPNVLLPEGSAGTIVYIYDAHPPVYEVEFSDRKGHTLGVHTVKEEDLVAES